MSKKHLLLTRSTTLRQLEVFNSIARNQSFTKTAKELHLTQPTVSIQVKKLSETLGTPLFEQIGRHISLTPAGEKLHLAVIQILELLSNTEEEIDRLKGFSGGNIKLSVISTSQYFVPKVIHDFGERYPDVSVTMRVGNRENLINRIQENKDDFYILGQPPEGLNVDSMCLGVNPLAFIANSTNPLCHETQLKLEDLAQAPFLMREKGSGIRSHIEKVFNEYDFTPNIKMVLGGNESIRLGLLQDLGITVTSISTVAEEIDNGRLSVLNVKGFPINRYWFLVYPKGKIQSISAEALINMIKDYTQSPSLSL